MTQSPLVSIGIPTYNRRDGLERAVRSALDQTCADIEVLISDNASTDSTEAFVAQMMRADDRVQYRRRPANVGPTANFNGLIQQARGTFFLFLSDDDWLDPDFVRARLEVLQGDDRVALACGPTIYERGGEPVTIGVPMNLSSPSAVARVATYFRTVDDNGTVYGMMRTADARAIPEMGNVIGGDWLFVANLAALGHVNTDEHAPLHRSIEGNSTSVPRIRKTLGLPLVQAVVPYGSIWTQLLRDVAWRSRAFDRLSRRERLFLLLRVVPGLVRRQTWYVAFAATAPLRRTTLARRILGLAPRGLRFPGHATRAPAGGEQPTPARVK